MEQDNIPIQLIDNQALPWSVRDTWMGLALLIVIQVAMIAILVILKLPRAYAGISLILPELMYLMPAVIIMAWRHASWRLLGYRRFAGSFIGIGCGLLVGAYFVTLINNTIFVMLGQAIQANEFMQILEKLPSPDSFIFTGVILAPIVEEAFFRGFLFAGFRQRYGWNKAALLSSAIFAAAHLQPASLIPTFALGYIFSYLYQKSNSLFPGMIMHFLVNAFGIFMLLLFARLGWVTPR